MKTIHISNQIHRKLKIQAAQTGQNIRQIIEEAVGEGKHKGCRCSKPTSPENLSQKRQQREREERREKEEEKSPPHTPPLKEEEKEKREEKEKKLSFPTLHNNSSLTGARARELKKTAKAYVPKIVYELPAKLAPSFNAFWEAYPRKAGKQTCKQLWGQLKPSEQLLTDILAALEWQRKSEPWQGGYVPLPATWLRQHRWKDEPSEKLARDAWEW